MASKNAAYWKKRFEQMEAAQYKKGAEAYAHIEEQYSRAQKQIENEIRVWYQRFADNNEITLQEAHKMLTSKELAEFKWDVNDYIKYGEENAMNGKWMKELENASAKYHISRLQSLELQMQQQCEVLFGNQLDTIDAAMRDIFTSGYYHTAFEIQKGMEVGWDFASLDTKTIDKVINKPWAPDGKNFSERVWDDREKLVKELDQELVRGIITGQDPQKTIDAIAHRMNVSKSNAGRLVMTEEAYFSSEAQKDCFKELDVEKFEVVETLDSTTCEECAAMDGKVFPMSEWEVGITVPPFHPRCRGTTAPAFDDEFDKLGERAARGEEGETYYVPTDMTYKQWEAQFVNGGGKEGLQAVPETVKIDISTLNSGLATILADTEKEQLNDWLNSLEGTEREKWTDAIKNAEYVPLDADATSYYSPWDKKVHLSEYTEPGTVIHETAHSIDDGAIHKTIVEKIGHSEYSTDVDSASAYIQQLLDGTHTYDDMKNLCEVLNVPFNNDKYAPWYDCDDQQLTTAWIEYSHNTIKSFVQDGDAFSCVSDIISGITQDGNGGSLLYGGHTKDYWQRPVTGGQAFYSNVEAWAEYCELKVMGRTDMLDVLKSLVPDMSNALETVYKEVFK